MKTKLSVMPLLAVFLFFLGSTQASNLPTNPPTTEKEPAKITAAKFPGGDQLLVQYISENLVYPLEARENAIEGMVIVTFNVSQQGTISEVKVLRKIGGGCDEEAIRTLEAMPDWEPAKRNGEPVNSKVVMPINFELTTS